MIRKKFIKHGNSRALVIEKPILEMLNIEEETEVTITTDGKNLIVSPIPPKDRSDDPAFLWAAKMSADTHRKTLDNLAKT